jgi:hypothetical protein
MLAHVILITALAATATLTAAPLQQVPPPGAANAAADDITVRAKGHGANPGAAKDDAIREALKRAVGMFVDSKTITDSDKIVSDRILSTTGALVLGSKVTAGPSRSVDGLYEVECDVRIKKRTLVSQLSDAGFKVTGSVDGDAATRVAGANFRNAKQAEALLTERLANLWSKLFIGRIIDENGIPLGDGELPKVVQRNDGTVVVCANVQIYFHLEAYYTKLVPELQPLLESLASDRKELTVNRPIWRGDGPALATLFGRIPIQACIQEPWCEDKDGFWLWLSVGRDRVALTEHFVGYQLPKALAGTLTKLARRTNDGRYRIELLSGSGKVIAAVSRSGKDTRLLGTGQGNTPLGALADPRELVNGVSDNRSPRWCLLWCSESRPEGDAQLSPAHYNEGGDHYGWGFRGGCGYVCDVLEDRIEMAVPASDMSSVKSYRITAVDGTSGPN